MVFFILENFQNSFESIQLAKRNQLVPSKVDNCYKNFWDTYTSMPRWEYDTVFYRVFCITLLGLALTFTVILTNVFIDIDGLLSKNSKANTEHLEKEEISNMGTDNLVYDFKDYADAYDMERTKRSLEPQDRDFSFQIKDPQMKKAVTNRLAALLEELDKGKSKTSHREKTKNKIKDSVKQVTNAKYTDINPGNTQEEKVRNKNFRDVELLDNFEKSEDFEELDIMNDIERLKKEKEQKQIFNKTVEELKHLTLHNIILQGIVEHMDLGKVYARVQSLNNNLETTEVKQDNAKGILHASQDEQFLNELMHCQQLQKQIDTETSKRKNLGTQIVPERINKNPLAKSTGRNVMIKTIIDITSLANGKSNQIESSKENVNGIVKLIYNGKSLKFRRIDEATTISSTNTRDGNEKYSISTNVETVKDAEDKILGNSKTNADTYVPKIYMNRIINQYLNRYSKESESFEDTKKSTTKRLKRHISIRYENEATSKTTTENPKTKGRKGEDELFVEIETHFDSKGLNGEKKKKMIRDLIRKIQKAIHSNRENEKTKHAHLRVKKRTQNPLDSETASPLPKMALPSINTFQHRKLDPIIGKSAQPYDSLPHVADSRGDEWKKYNGGPRFLNPSKGINSVEMGELDSDYNKVLENGIPQRLQKPLNTDAYDELSFNNVRNQKKDTYNLEKENHVIMKDIAGSGFTIGYNQYVAEAPDPESMKLFTGIEDIIKEYHQKYDEGTDDAENADDANPESSNPTNEEQYQDKPLIMIYPAPEKNEHSIVRRSFKNVTRDYHSNEYKDKIYNNNLLDYDKYQDIYNSKGHWSKAKTTQIDEAPLVLDENIFEKALKPAEIFSLANLLGRKKRSLHHVRRITNIKNKKKLQTFLNTNSMANRKIFQHNKRNKRQINKIRIIAKDISKTKHNSEEDIFVLSDEKVFADRALVKEVETPAVEPNEVANEEHFDVIAPQTPHEGRFEMTPQQLSENHYDIISPYSNNDPELETNNDMKTYLDKSRHNSLMSRYPHIFIQDIARSKEDLVPDNAIMFGKILDNYEGAVTTPGTPTMVDIPQAHAEQNQYILPVETEAKFQNPEVQEIIDRYPIIPSPSQEKGNYKVTVKILPKNMTGINSGFKEIHTSINKSYNKNGLVYTSLVNVSEISKIDKFNKTQESKRTLAHPAVKKLQIEQMRMKSMIQQHKDRIENQMVHLTKEREKLNRMDFRNAEFFSDVPKDVIDDTVHKSPATTLRITQEELQELLNYRKNMKSTTSSTTTETPTTITDATTAKQTTTTEFLEHTEDPEKIKIFNTIARNEMITNEILTKIDKNANILQTFLNKIIAKLESTTQKPLELTDSEVRNINQQAQRTNEILNPNILFNHKNGQESPGIPFVYAFQQPYNIPNGNNKEVPIANVVYQGHIHSQPLNIAEQKKKYYEKENQKGNEWKASNTKPDIKNNNKIVTVNATKFFIDDLDDAKPVFTRVSVNSTKV